MYCVNQLSCAVRSNGRALEVYRRWRSSTPRNLGPHGFMTGVNWCAARCESYTPNPESSITPYCMQWNVIMPLGFCFPWDVDQFTFIHLHEVHTFSPPRRMFITSYLHIFIGNRRASRWKDSKYRQVPVVRPKGGNKTRYQGIFQDIVWSSWVSLGEACERV